MGFKDVSSYGVKQLPSNLPTPIAHEQSARRAWSLSQLAQEEQAHKHQMCAGLGQGRGFNQYVCQAGEQAGRGINLQEANGNNHRFNQIAGTVPRYSQCF